ncbi:dienelactone hydrolase family protein [uncultured Algibacter sp.]|uniref:alpha/beta hydrolase family protein n=1 Tax=uncultured Algibacter sp. TaxID=298659 RepID=UPI002633EC0F|nr:dienelactone hydrolase family protein [uncultured Algibacter sp.]
MKILKRVILFGVISISSLSFSQESTHQFDYAPKTEFNDAIVDSKILDYNGCTFEKIVIDGFDSKVPFYLITPKKQKNNKYIFILHGGTSSKEDLIYPTNNLSILKDSLLLKGYSIIIPDAKYHGERSYQGNFRSPLKFFSSQDYETVNDFLFSTVKDLRILMDYLQSKPEHSLAIFEVLGYSMGGHIAILLNSVDDRLNHVVACIAPLDLFKLSIKLGMNEENAKKVESLSAKNNALLQKAPITMFMGTEDEFYSEEEVQAFFNDIKIKDKKLKFYNTGHFLPDEFNSDAIKYILRE